MDASVSVKAAETGGFAFLGLVLYEPSSGEIARCPRWAR
jgi:hypothetical protein